MLQLFTDSTRLVHSAVRVCTLSCGLLGLCALSYRASSYATTQNQTLHFRALSHISSLFHLILILLSNYLQFHSIYTIPRSMDHGQADVTLHYITTLRADNPMIQYTFHTPHPQFAKSYNIFDQNLGFKPQDMLWGDSMPKRPPTKTSRLTLK